MIRNRLLAPLTLLLLLPACAQWKATARINPSTVAVYPGAVGKDAQRRNGPDGNDCRLTGGYSDGKRGAINLDCFQFPEDSLDNNKRPTAYERATMDHWLRLATGGLQAGSVGEDGLKVANARAANARNRLSAILVKHADDVCLLEKGRLVATESSVNFILSFLTQAFSGASTIVQGELAKTILSGVATLASGTQSNVNATFYRNQLVQAINKTLDSERDRIRGQLAADRSRDIEAYTVDEMIVSVNSYHQACSFERGLQVLLDKALDKSGADAVLASRSRDAAIAELNNHINTLDRRIRTLGTSDLNKADVEALRKQRSDAEARKNGLVMARTDKLIVNPSAGDTSETHEEAPPAPPPATPPPATPPPAAPAPAPG